MIQVLIEFQIYIFAKFLFTQKKLQYAAQRP
jgi:hypothetical protein